MREIEFRGKWKNNGKWVYGCYIKADRKEYIYVEGETTFDTGRAEIIPKTTGQYTGLKDKNNVKIFEGDILECERHIPDTNFKKEKFRHVVHFDNGVFYALQEFLFEKTIIGNIHDTPDLSGRKQK